MVFVGPHIDTVPQISIMLLIKKSLSLEERRTLQYSSSLISMEEFNRSRSHGNGQMMQMESYYGAPRPYDLRSYSASYAQTQMGLKDFKLKKGKSISSSISKSLSFADPEFQRKKRVASYKMYSVEGKVKGSFRKSFRWLKNKYSQVVYGW